MRARTTTLRLSGSGEHLRLRVAGVPDPLTNVRECCRASVAVDKALGEAIRDARAAGHSWGDLGNALGVEGSTPAEVRDDFIASRRTLWSRFWGGEPTK